MATAASESQFTGKHMLAWVVSFFGVIIAVNLTMAYFANSTWSGLIVKNGYVASQSFDQDLARSKTQEALGWSVTIAHDVSGVSVQFTYSAGRGLSGLAVSGQLRRPATDRQDQTLAFRNDGAGSRLARGDQAVGQTLHQRTLGLGMAGNAEPV